MQTLTFSQFIREEEEYWPKMVRTFTGGDTPAVIFKNPSKSEILEDMMKSPDDDSSNFHRIGRVNTSEPIRGILTGGGANASDDAYLWLERSGMHDEIVRSKVITNLKPDYIPISVNYNRMKNGFDVDLALVQYGEEHREKQVFNKKGIKTIIDRITNSNLNAAGNIHLAFNIRDIADQFGVSIDNNIQENLSYSIKKRKSGDGVRYQIMQGRRLVGTIGGFEDTYRDQFHIFATGLKGERGDAGTIHGTGIYQAVVQHVANLYQNGAFVHTWESSDALKKALAKMPTHRIEGDKIIISPTV